MQRMVDMQCAQTALPRFGQLRQRVQQRGRVRAAAECDAERTLGMRCQGRAQSGG